MSVDFQRSQGLSNCCLKLFPYRMFHIDDVPSGAGEGIKDVNKALAVSSILIIRLLRMPGFDYARVVVLRISVFWSISQE